MSSWYGPFSKPVERGSNICAPECGKGCDHKRAETSKRGFRAAKDGVGTQGTYLEYPCFLIKQLTNIIGLLAPRACSKDQRFRACGISLGNQAEDARVCNLRIKPFRLGTNSSDRAAQQHKDHLLKILKLKRDNLTNQLEYKNSLENELATTREMLRKAEANLTRKGVLAKNWKEKYETTAKVTLRVR